MKKIFLMVFVLGTMITGFTTSAFAAYVCKKQASGACVQNLATGQCAQSFTKKNYDNPMAACERALGATSASYDPKDYTCRDFGSRVCAVNKNTNQCTHSWNRGDHANPMFLCQKFTGNGPKPINKSNFECKQYPSRVCAKDLRTGQCTHQWKSGEYSNPMRMCLKWIGQ